MSLLNPTLLLALPLAIIPVLLHLLLRSKPKRMAFPALRLIQSRRKSNTRRFRMKQFWLMLLRVIVIAFFILLLARPSLPAANYTPNLYESLMTFGLVAAAVGACWGLKKLWERRKLPRHQIAYRQTMSRSIAGVAGVILFLLLVIWPYAHRLRAELTSPRPIVSENIPSAAIFLFDTSLSMEYRSESDTRLDVARKIASEHLDQLPNGSRVAITTNQDQSAILFQIDKTTAREHMYDLELAPSTVKLNTRLWDSLSFQEQDRERIGTEQNETEDEITDRYIREVYLFTDLSRNSWDLAEQQYLKGELERLEFVQVYLIDVSKQEPKNISLSNIRLQNKEFLKSQPISMSVTVQAERQTDITRQVELYTENSSGEMVRRAAQEIQINAGTPQSVELSYVPEDAVLDSKTDEINNETNYDWQETVQGEIRLNSTDAMTFDNQRFFTVNRRLPPKVLIVSGATGGGPILQDVLAPGELRKNNKAPYRCDLVRQEALLDMSSEKLQSYDNICLVSVRQPREEIWSRLESYVTAGGGLFVVAGSSRIDPVEYTTDAALAVLPAELKGFIEFEPPEFIDFEAGKNHPLLKPFDQYGSFGDLPAARVNWCWSVAPHPSANVIANYTFNKPRPAIIDRVLGRGHSMMLTTSVDRGEWSTLARSWWFLVLADKIMDYSAGGNELMRNYMAGEAVVLPLPADEKSASYLLRQPNLKQLPLTADTENNLLLIRNTETLGHYQVLQKSDLTAPFFQYSMNIADAESNFDPITSDELDSLLGEKRYQLSRSINELTRQVGLGRIGQEMFPMVLGLLFAFFWGEHFIANRFYDHEQTPLV
ncbi:hypothetical protein Pla110_31040 [Polystyrenella longa]|uniref:Aerotolerance regulator N-terminal domain-containing protein n=1 Tax=Polystyrenella longa TaxID=2528007 RepID=A0A518CQ74_9PLAN|nr:BatA and WFA domain-containing protein [Polystyrenella longa]QDU81363.1 hypothetical protein Pla110_31040 [Polystyrenella longa]